VQIPNTPFITAACVGVLHSKGRSEVWSDSSRGLTAAFTFALIPIKLFLQIGLSVNGLRQGADGYFEDFVAVVACSYDWCCTQPLHNLETPL
jgi:hypothetical protein